MTKFRLAPFLLVLLLASCARHEVNEHVVRVAIIGGMMHTGLWAAITDKFEAKTGYKIEVVAAGTRTLLAPALREGKVDLLTMHSGDITTDLVADGYAKRMRPWTHNELVIVGPKADPAGIRGMTNAVAALRQIAAKQAPFVDFQGVGSREMVSRLWHEANVRLQGPWVIKDESLYGEEVVEFAYEHHAYVIVGRIPVMTGKMPADGMEIMVRDDPFMRRPYIVMEANPAKFPNANVRGAEALSDFLFSKEVQDGILPFKSAATGNIPLFFPIEKR